MKRLASAMAILLLSVAAACGQPPNPLLGTWEAVPGPGATTIPYCATPMVFTATTQTLTWGGRKLAPENVKYVAAQTATYPTTVYVLAINSANHQTYNFTSKDTMSYSSAAGCYYRRK